MIFLKDQNELIPVSDISHLDKAFKLKVIKLVSQGYRAFGLQNGFQGSQIGCHIKHNPIR